MGLFDVLFRRPDLEEGLERWRETPDAILLDVRTPGGVPGRTRARGRESAPGPPARGETACGPAHLRLLPQRRPERPGLCLAEAAWS